jgi:hypothetical protein
MTAPGTLDDLRHDDDVVDQVQIRLAFMRKAQPASSRFPQASASL